MQYVERRRTIHAEQFLGVQSLDLFTKLFLPTSFSFETSTRTLVMGFKDRGDVSIKCGDYAVWEDMKRSDIRIVERDAFEDLYEPQYASGGIITPVGLQPIARSPLADTIGKPHQPIYPADLLGDSRFTLNTEQIK